MFDLKFCLIRMGLYTVTKQKGSEMNANKALLRVSFMQQ